VYFSYRNIFHRFLNTSSRDFLPRKRRNISVFAKNERKEKKEMKTRANIRRSIKAVSPVISVLLMIAIAVAASLVAYAWVMGYMGGTTTKVGKAVLIQSMAKNTGDDKLIVYVQNVGQGPVTISSTYVNDELQTFTTDKTDNKLDEGNTATATIDYVVTPGVQVKVKVVTTEGISAESTNFNLNGGGGGSIPVARTLTVTVSSGNGDVTKDPDQASYADGTPVTLEAIPDDGWSFHEWDGDLTGSVNPTTITMDGDKTVTATFTQNEYALTINTVGSGSVDKLPDQLTYHLGDSVQLTANPVAGSTFSGWSGDLGGSTNPENLIIDADPEVTATFTLTQYQVTFQQSGLSGDASGTVLTVGSTTYTQSQLPLTNIWVDDGTTFLYTGTVSAGATKQYVLTGVTGGLASPIHASGTATGNYKTQYQVTFDQKGLDSSATDVVTIGGITKTKANLPYSDWFDYQTAYSYNSQVSTTDVHKTFERTGGASSGQITATGTLTGIYGRLILRPESDGSSTSCGTHGESANYNCVDESSADGDSTYVYGTGDDSYRYDYYNIPDVGTISGTVTINSVTVNMVSMAESQNSYNDVRGRTVIFYNSNRYDGTERILPTSGWTPYSDAFSRPGGGTWTFTNINSLQIGVGLRSHNSSGNFREARCTQVWVVIEYTVT
jgi:FlaG/FlaF family flagellin (archaellin)